MLIEFRVKNHRSIRDEQILSMKASRRIESKIPARHPPGSNIAMLPVAAIYGANASGKSNVISAMSFMRDAVIFSQRIWAPDEGVPRDPFAWGDCRTEPSIFEMDFLAEGVRYNYGFAATDEAIIEEWLDAWPRGNKQRWFLRTKGDFKFYDQFSNPNNESIRSATGDNALFLSTAVQFQHVQLKPVYNWFRQMDCLFKSLGRANRHKAYGLQREFMVAQLIERRQDDLVQPPLFKEEEELSLFYRFRKLIKSADVGVVDFRTKSDEEDERTARRIGRIQLKHLADTDDAWLPIEEESRGTRTLIQIAIPILHAIDQGAVLVIDELESSLHPNIAEEIVRQFNSPKTNPNNAQLVFTTHDTNLLANTRGDEDPVLRRDEVWLTEKNPQGGTELYPLSDFKPRKAENLERGYLQGRYSAIPFLDDFVFSPEKA